MVLTSLRPTAGMKCIQYTLLTFNAIFSFTGIILISVGSMVNEINEDFTQFLESNFFSPSILIISIGCLVFAFALFGCYGAYKLSVAAIMIFSFLLATVFVLEFTASLIGYIVQDEIGDMLVRTMNRTMSEYETDPVAAQAIDDLQYGFYCCGMKGPEDWSSVIKLSKQEDGVALPLSCCAHVDHGECLAIKRMGCLSQLEFLLNQSTLLLTSTVLLIALMQLLGVTFAYKLARELRQQKTMRDHFKWEVKENIISISANNQSCKLTNESDYSALPNYAELFPSSELNENK